jgi:eukaryotic-like serine/threonine-protein kinase
VLIFALSGGVIGGLGAGSLNHITSVETISWKWNQFWKRAILGSIVGLILGLSEGGLDEYWLSNNLRSVLIFVFLGAVVSGLAGGFIGRVKEGKASSNQGIKLSCKNSLAAFLVTWLIGGLSVGVISGLIAGLTAGLIVGLIVGLNRGGSAVIKHYALRLTLWWKGYTPFKFVKFLDHCAKLILLKKVGGGYIFIHRMLLEYFAEMTPSRDKKN